MESAGAISVLLFALLTAVTTGLGAVPFAFAKHPTRGWLGASNAIAAGLMLAASFGLIYEGVNHGLFRTLTGALLGLGFIVAARRFLRQEEHPAVFASMSGLDARKALLVRGGQKAWPPKRVIIGDDGSEPAKRAGELGAVIAKLLGAEAALVRAYENPPEPIRGWTGEDRREFAESLSRERQALEGRAKELEMIAGSRPEARLIDTEPTLAMLVVAEEGDEEETLLSVGNRGLGAAKRAMLGSLSTKLLRVARGPVLVCPPK